MITVPNKFANAGAGNPSPLPGIQSTPAAQLDANFIALASGAAIVTAYGADPSRSSDSTAAILAAVAALGSSGGVVFFPPGGYLISAPSLITASNITFMGAGPGISVLWYTQATGGMFNFSGFNAQIIGLGFKPLVAQTAGAFLSLSGPNPYLQNFEMDGAFHSIDLLPGSTEVVISDGIMQHQAAAASGLTVTSGGAGPNLFRNVTLVGTGAQTYGVNLLNADDVQFDTCNIIGMGTQLAMQPGAGQIVESIWCRGCYFDNGAGFSGQTGVLINAPTSTSTVERIEFVNCWSSSHTVAAVLMENTGGGSVNQVGVYAHESFGNTGAGLQIGSGITGVIVEGGTFAGNTLSGILAIAGAADFTVLGVQSGAYAGFGGNGRYGVEVQSGASDHYIITNNRVRGNTTGTVIDGGSGSNKSVTQNIG
jgi:hypothetical protein